MANGSAYSYDTSPFTTNTYLKSFEVVNGLPAICYTQDVDTPESSPADEVGGLYYVRAHDGFGVSWSEPVGLGDVGDASLKVVNGVPAVACTHGGLAYIEADDSSGMIWKEPVMVDSGARYENLMQFGTGPAICYEKDYVDELRFAIPEL